eukprot:scaffold275168_cov18-Tisochrysis_lutea.AAC.4
MWSPSSIFWQQGCKQIQAASSMKGLSPDQRGCKLSEPIEGVSWQNCHNIAMIGAFCMPMCNAGGFQ